MRALANAVIAVGLVFVLGLALRGYSASRATAPAIVAAPSQKPQRQDAPAVKPDTAPRRIIASMEGNRCWIDALANGEKFHFLIDTGSSDIWFDGPAMARRLGFKNLTYDETYTGGGRAASVRLREFRIGGFAVNDVVAYIDKGGTVYGGRGPLFGMSVLKGVRLEVENGGCALVLPR